ncbi:elongin C [Mycoemilia scoparia]|uniref:Elongin-C n=1 Tax=Mycoemilia scoparia TaxID=417184 RepID=A0A9W7ZZF1_9FUNG|nr:elongin C [Mycoemilia scoparia]
MSNEKNNATNGPQGQKEDQMVMILSGDGFEFIIEKDIAVMAGTLKNMLQITGDVFVESNQQVIHLEEIRQVTIYTIVYFGEVLEKVIQYLIYKYRFSDKTNQIEVPEFPIEPEITLDLMMAADYLDC